MADDLAELEPFLAAYLNRLGPAQRRRVARKVGEALRRENAKRIAANVQPDGSGMEPRKTRKRMKDAKGRIKRTGKMFPKIRLAKALRIRATPDEVEIGFYNPMMAQTARAHHFGLTDFVGRTKDGQVIKTKYPERRLLGFSADDVEIITRAAMDLLEA